MHLLECLSISLSSTASTIYYFCVNNVMSSLLVMYFDHNFCVFEANALHSVISLSPRSRKCNYFHALPRYQDINATNTIHSCLGALIFMVFNDIERLFSLICCLFDGNSIKIKRRYFSYANKIERFWSLNVLWKASEVDVQLQ